MQIAALEATMTSASPWGMYSSGEVRGAPERAARVEQEGGLADRDLQPAPRARDQPAVDDGEDVGEQPAANAPPGEGLQVPSTLLLSRWRR
jgi:hypothetical protein